MATKYDPAKAALYNKLILTGISENTAARQAGISEAEDDFYRTNEVGSDNPLAADYNPNRGKMGPAVDGTQAALYQQDIASGKTEQQAFDALQARRAEAKASRLTDRAEDDDEDELFERSDVAINAKTPPNTAVVTQSVTTDTETVSGGGTTTRIAGPTSPNIATEALQPAIVAKQAEIDQFIKDNPSNRLRVKDGLPKLTLEEQIERQGKLDDLQFQQSELEYQQKNLRTPGAESVTTVPNTTTTTQTVVTGTTSVNSAVNFNNDEQLFQQTETQIDARGRAPNANTATAPSPVSTQTTVDEFGQVVPVATQNPAPPPEPTGGSPAQADPGPGIAPTAAQEAAARQAATLDKARAQNTIAEQRKNVNNADWRVKLRLAPLADYLYMAKPPGILAPLAPDGVIFPYTPTIQTSYKATYATTDITHSNYRGYFYQGSAVEPFTISSTFTAQSTAEAEYLLAVIHFFKSVTKMFYGQDPQRGTPPPLVYLTGLGQFQFNEHPCVVSGFTYDLPADVDYIRAYSANVNNSNMLQQRQANNSTGPGTSWGNGILGGVLGGAVNRLASSKLFNGQPLPKGGMNIPPAPANLGPKILPTYVPTKMTIAVSLLPVVSRQAQSQRFSVRQYATGDLQKGGMW